VFAVAEDPVKLGLVASLARPSGNATGINFFFAEVIAKRLRLLHDLVPKATRIAVLVNRGNASTAESTIQEVKKAAPAMGLEIQAILNAATPAEIDVTFASFERERPALGPPSCRCCNRPSSNSSSTFKRRGRSASTCRQDCFPSPME
jgi:putative ABC transport system substrate-binding protein